MIKRFLWAIGVLVLLYSVAGFLLLPYLLEKLPSNYVQTHSDAHLQIDNISFNPYTFELELEHLKLTDPYGLEFLKFSQLYLDMDLNAIFEKRLIFKNLQIADLKVQLAHFRDGRLSYEWLAQLAQQSRLGIEKDPEAAYYYLLNAKNITLDATTVDLKEQHIAMASVHIDTPVISVTRAMPFGEPAPKPEALPETQESIWRVDLVHLGIDSGALEFQDFNIPGAAYSLQDQIHISLDNISSAPETALRYDVAMRLDGSGRLTGKGTLQHTPLVQKGSLRIDDLPLKPGSSYLERFAYAKLDSGSLSLDINVSFAAKEDGSELRIDGTHAMHGLKLVDTRDATPLLSLASLDVQPVHFSLQPKTLQIGTVRCDGLYANIRQSAEGLNLATLLKKETRPETAPPPAEEAKAEAPDEGKFAISVERLVLHDNGADYTDTTLPEPFSTSLRTLEGTVSGINTELKGRSHFDLKGVLDTYGTVALNGDLAVADPKRYTEFDVQMRNLDMSQMTPYTIKFVGRRIDAGRLFLDLGYRVESSQLKGRNDALIKQIALGDQVESEGAVSLPLDLAVALLKDRQGVIDVKMPVEGDLNDPDFKYGATVWKAVANLLSNVATAPFRFLGSLLGIEGDKLESIAFATGGSELLPPERETLDNLSKALKERPGLLLEVAGTYEPVGDTAALQKQKATTLLNSGLKSSDIDAVITRLEQLLADAVTPEQLKSMQTAVRKDHPEDEAFKAYYRDRLMQQLTALQNVDPSELIVLADARAAAITSYLETAGVAKDQLARKASAVAENADAQWVHIPLGINTK